MLLILILAISPVLAILMFVYYEDKYEKEPLLMLINAFFLGFLAVIISIVIYKIFPENFFTKNANINRALLINFLIGIIEETSKFLIFILFIWKNKNFNEKFDGIIYSVFISLGFASLENLKYILIAEDPYYTAILRGLTSVPAHGIFGVSMGFFIGKAKFDRKSFIILAILIPIILHFLYDLLIDISMNVWIPISLYLIFFSLLSFLMIKKHSEDSLFKP